MATATSGSFTSVHFPCHGVVTSTAHNMGDGTPSDHLGWAFGWDGSYNNFYSQGVPITIPDDADGNVTSVTVSITYRGWNNGVFPGRTIYVCCLPTRYDSLATGTKQYDNVKGYTGQASFTTPNSTTNGSATVTISGLSLAPGSTHYVYIHIGTYKTYSSLFVCQNMTVSCTYEEGGKVRIYTSSGWVSATPYVYTSSGWVKAKPYVYTSSGWTKCK